MENHKKNVNTTIAIAIEENKRLSAFCKRNKLTKKDFIPIAIQYFEKNRINPKTHSEPKVEIEKISKRVDQLFGFIKTQEKDYLRPAIEAIVSTETRLIESINSLSTKDDLNMYFKEIPMENYIKAILKQLSKNEELDNKRFEELKSEIEMFHSKILNELEQIKTKKGFTL